MSEAKEKDTQIIDSERVTVQDIPDALEDIEVKNPRIGRVLKLQEEAERQNELEKLRSRRIRQQQEYIDKMINSVEQNLKNTREEAAYNEAFEQQIKEQVYRMHGISADKLEGMTEARRSWYQGAAFALFFLSLVMIVLCGVLHGFGSEICIFMAFFTAIEGTLLSNGRKQSKILEGLIKVLYLLLFPAMMVIFVCYELGFKEYTLFVPWFTVAGVVVLMVGAVSYFIYDPYRAARRSQKKANSYIREMERTATKEIFLKEKAYAKQEKKKEKKEARKARHEKWSDWWSNLWNGEKKEAENADKPEENDPAEAETAEETAAAEAETAEETAAAEAETAEETAAAEQKEENTSEEV